MSEEVAGRQRRRRLEEVLDHLPAAVAILSGPDLIIEYANPPARALTSAPLEGRADEVTEDTNQGVLAAVQAVRDAGMPRTIREAPLTFDGVDHRFDISIVPVREPDGAESWVLVHAVDVTEQVSARARAEEFEHRYRSMVDANVVGVTVTGEEEILEANDAFLEMVGHTRDDVESGRLKWTELTAPEFREHDERVAEQLRTDGFARPFEKEYQRADGSRVPVLLSGSTLELEPFRVLATIYDLSERRKLEDEIGGLLERERDARLQAELAGVRAARLQEVTAAMSAANSPDEIARTIVHQAVEVLGASAGMIALIEGADVVPSYSIGYEREALDQWRRFPLSSSNPTSDAISANEAVTLVDLADWRLRYPGIAAHIRHFQGFAAIPLAGLDRTLGALILSFRQPRQIAPEDREFLLALGRQSAQAFERARLFENRAYVARKLQEGLLPDALDPVPGLESAVRYQSISGGGEVGGDFYDLFEAGHGRWALAIGDVCGKGTEAAVVTGLARHTVRAIARVEDGPADVLAFLNDELRRHGDPPSFCTVGFAVIEPTDEGRFHVRMASGGHPYPLLVRGAGSGVPEPVEVTGTMLGVAQDPNLEDIPVTLGPGDALIFYTDGVTDARGQGRDRFGEDRLRAAVASAHGGDAEAIAAAVEAAVSTYQPVALTDDRAILVVRAAP